MMSHDDEPVRGLPEALPEGERVLWQGCPDWTRLARHAFFARGIALLFAGLILWRTLSLYGAPGANGRELSIGEAFVMSLAFLPLAAAAMLLAAGLALLTARASLYTITNRRVAMKVGVGFNFVLNLPFAQIEAARFAQLSGGAGEISLQLKDGTRIDYLMLWPHARPWFFSRPEPMMRAIPNADRVAEILGDALREFAAEAQPEVSAASTPDHPPNPSGPAVAAARGIAPRPAPAPISAMDGLASAR